MSEHGEQKITWEGLKGLGFPLVSPASGPSTVEEADAELKGVTHLFVVVESVTGTPPSVHLVTEWGALDLDELRAVEWTSGRGGPLGSAARYRRPLNRLSEDDRRGILWDSLGRDGRVRPVDIDQLGESSGTRGLSLKELGALRLIIDRFRNRGDNVDELVHRSLGIDGGDIEGFFGLSCHWLRPRKRPSTAGERGLVMKLAALRTLQRLGLDTGPAGRAIEERLSPVVIRKMITSEAGTVILPATNK